MNHVDSLGFIGLGIMGEPMARNLLRAGTPLVVWNRSPASGLALEQAGASLAGTPGAVFEQAGTVILMLATETAIDAVLERGSAAFQTRLRGHTLVQMSTVSADYSRALEADVLAAGGRYVEAPVSGSRKPAEDGQLVAMLAGAADTVAEVEPLLAPMCRQTVRCGDVPKALLMKFASNAVLLPLITGLAEAFHLADRQGLDPRQLLEVLNGGQIASPISRVKAEKLAGGDFSPQAAVSDVLKNSRLTADAARRAGVATPLVDLCRTLYAETEEMGLGQEDVTAVIRALEARTRDQGDRG